MIGEANYFNSRLLDPAKQLIGGGVREMNYAPPKENALRADRASARNPKVSYGLSAASNPTAIR